VSWRRWVEIFGCADLTSVVPCGAPSKTIEPKVLGKLPGYKKKNGLWVGITGSMADRIMTLAEAKQASHDGAGVGMNARNFPGFDIDVNNWELTQRIIAFLIAELGPAPVRTVEGNPHALLMYAISGVGAFIRKRRLAFRLPGDPTKHAVELLGLGQYYNLEMMHQSGKPYRWSPDPCELGPFNLTVITMEQVLAVFAALPARFGLEPLAGSSTSANLISGRRTRLGDVSKMAPSAEHVLRLLAEYKPEELGHDDFVRHMCAIKASLGPDCEEYYPDVFEWAPGIRSTEDEATRKVWDSIADTALGWQWLVDKSGTKMQVQDDFAEPPPADSYVTDPAELAIKQMVEGWIFSDAGFHEESTGRVVSKDLFNAQHTHVIPYGLTGRKTAAALFQNHKRARKANVTIYRPAAPVYIESEKAVNVWRSSLLEPVFNTDPKPYRELWEMLMPDDADLRNHYLDWIGFALQNRGVKIGHALVLQSDAHGVGKDTAFVPLLRGLGEDNYVKLTPAELAKPYNPFLDHELIIISEMRDFDRGKGQMYLTIKNHIGIEEGAPQVDQKYEKHRKGYRSQNWVILTNYGNAIALDEEDRRLCIAKSPMQPQSISFYEAIWDFLNHGGDAVCLGWFLRRDVSKFNRAARAPMTDAKRAMIEATMSPAKRWLRAQFSEGGQFHGRKLLTVGEIMDANEWGTDNIHAGNILTALWKYGYSSIETRVKMQGAVVTVWTNDARLAKLSGEFLSAALLKDRKRQ
jgi:hypothetical protein